MTSVSQFAQYLLKLEPQRNQSRLTFYNFLRHLTEPTLPFSPAIVQSFYARVLQFEHWQQEAQTLSDTLKADIGGFLKQQPLGKEEFEAWSALRHPDTLQLVHLKLFQDLEDLTVSEHAPRQRSGDEVKTVKLDDHKILVLILQPSGILEVKVYPPMALVWGPRLRLVAPVTHLTYSPELELMPHVKQILDGSLMTTHCFHVDVEGVHGLIARGSTFQKFETFIRAPLPDTQDLFTSLKRLERHFINPQTDPFYQELISRLEKANRLLNTPNADNLATAERALNKGRLYLKNIFTGDRLLSLLVTHLDYGLNQRRTNAPSQQIHQSRPSQTQ